MHYHSQRDLYEDLDSGREAERIQRHKEVQVSDVKKLISECESSIKWLEGLWVGDYPAISDAGGELFRDAMDSVAQEFETLLKCYKNLLAKAPADDSEPITADWLKSVGFTIYGIMSDYNGGFAKEDLEWHERKVWRWRDKTLPKQPKTRFDLRRLADALGIALAESADKECG